MHWLIFQRGFSPESLYLFAREGIIIPRYSRFQYGIKQYGQYESKSGNIKKVMLLSGRIGIRSGDKTIYIYSHTPVSINGKITRLRIKDNFGSLIHMNSISINGDIDKVRIRTNKLEDEIISVKGWG